MLRLIFLRSLLICILLHIKAAKSEVCSEGLIPCDDEKCIGREDWCNGLKDCEDGSDEAYCKGLSWFGTNINKCTNHFRCDDGPCWPKVIHCDGHKDCKDASDEEQCNMKSEESSEEDDSGETKTTEAPPSTTVSDSSEYDDYNEITDPTTSTSPKKATPSHISTTPYIDTTAKVSLLVPTAENDYYAKKKKQIEDDNQRFTPMETVYIPKGDLSRTTDYRPSYVKPISSHTTRQIDILYQTSRKPSVAYLHPTRPYRIRSYRNQIDVPPNSRNSSPYRSSYPIQQPRHFQNNNRNPYNSFNNVIQSRSNINNRQRYMSSNDNNGGTDWRDDTYRSPMVYKRQRKVSAPFYFGKNYYEIYKRDNALEVERATSWILNIRNASGGWGKETPRALIALSLANNSFLAGTYENDLMQKYFQVHLAVNLLRNDIPSLNRLAMFVNALIATCQDPRDFQGWDLTELIRNTIVKLNRRSRSPFVNPLVYLSLCLADRDLTHYEIHHLMTYLQASENDEVARDMISLALEAFACHLQKEKNSVQYHSLLKMTWNTTAKIILRMKTDGSFGSVYSTALTTQALLSVNDTFEWKPNATFHFLKSHQLDDGSFGDFLATYYVLPALSGRSLLHLRNTRCNPPKIDRDLSPSEILEYPGPKHYVRYSLYLRSPLSNSYTIQVLVPSGISFFDIMRVAEYENDNFKFSFEEVNGKINVYSIADIPNDSEQGFAWRLYVKSNSDGEQNTPNIQEYYNGDIRQFFPTGDQHVIFWYHANGAQF
ncbi:uncharacterized protein NPIL_373021 [Nephila pilipes]|uniref:Uncharacterized protein n=1 Tax=Nephila pilipes TaxID=299642 RepID=A0A8X6T3A3_NEPPI|nr:uncharacterized protein NPIL_373021 [Nephila pilipes]